MHLSRRQFLQAGATTPLALGLTRPLLADEPTKRPAGERLTLGFIGVGMQSRGHLGGFLGMKDVQVVAVCDVVAERRDNARQMVEKQYARGRRRASTRACDAYTDFRELLDRKDIDAVVIATPGPLARHPVRPRRPGEQGHLLREAADARPSPRAGGSWTRCKKARSSSRPAASSAASSTATSARAVELVRNGRIGKLKTIRIGVGGPARPCDLPAQPVPDGHRLGLLARPGARSAAYNEILCPKGIHNHFPAWRNYQEYAGGGLADMGAHHFDIAQWALDMDGTGPVEIDPAGEGRQRACSSSTPTASR